MKLIINGDDLGYTLANTYGIIEAYQNGILRSTTALTNSRYIREAAECTKGLEGLGIGVHLTLTLGEALTDNKTLTDENGYFFKGPVTVFQHGPDYGEIYAEWKAQIERFIEVFGRMPTHLDSHHSVHDRTPEALKVSKRLAEEYGLPLRGYNPFTFVRDFNSHNGTTVEKLKEILIDHKDENIEIMCHPGYCDLELYRQSSNSLNRVVELDVLCSDEIREFIKDNGIELVHY
ncbi:MAG: carbohydrate deacetylase [Erysipelotrichaceae bacterium]|nr:carbohydrate deacetylase [Erysipelotrichaceae bacterium]